MTTRVLDVVNADSIQGVVEEIGTPDILFNCAGFVADGNILECSEETGTFRSI
jgi:2-keto-3-deoxy-L-fuconate dehydrogenase